MRDLIPLSNKDSFLVEFLGKKASQSRRKLTVEKSYFNFRLLKHQETGFNVCKAQQFLF
jgi:hypothetical protein